MKGTVFYVSDGRTSRHNPPRTASVSGFVGGALGAADGLLLFHSLLDGRLGIISPLLEFFQNARTLVLFLEALDSAVDGFVFLDDDADQVVSPS